MGGGIGEGESLFFNSVLQSALPWDMVGLMMPYSNIRVQWSQFLLQGLIRSLGPHGFWDEVVGLIFPLLYVKLSFQILPLFLVFCSLNLKYPGVGVFFVCFPVWCSPSFLDLLFNLGKFVVIVASNISFRFLIFPLYLCNSFSVWCSHSVMSDSLWPHGLQHTRPPCPSPTPGAYSNSCPSSRWCHPTISSSFVPFSSCLQSFPASGSFME